jgi:hypothetical protein
VAIPPRQRQPGHHTQESEHQEAAGVENEGFFKLVILLSRLDPVSLDRCKNAVRCDSFHRTVGLLQPLMARFAPMAMRFERRPIKPADSIDPSKGVWCSAGGL